MDKYKGGVVVAEMIPYEERMVHVRFEGRSQDIRMVVLDLGDLSTDQDVRQALAAYMDVPVRRFSVYVVERYANGNITVRPEAVFG
jgi:hypothetical protein